MQLTSSHVSQDISILPHVSLDLGCLVLALRDIEESVQFTDYHIGANSRHRPRRGSLLLAVSKSIRLANSLPMRPSPATAADLVSSVDKYNCLSVGGGTRSICGPTRATFSPPISSLTCGSLVSSHATVPLPTENSRKFIYSPQIIRSPRRVPHLDRSSILDEHPTGRAARKVLWKQSTKFF